MTNANTPTDFDTLHDLVDQWLTGVLPFPTLQVQLEAAVTKNASALATRVATYQNVLAQLVIRIEGAASFTEESCSFSQGDFAASLHDWLGKLESRLKTTN
jgi:hypothetical protein